MDQIATLKTPTGYMQQMAQVKANIEKANEGATPTVQDKVDIKGDSGLKKAGKFVLGAGIGTATAIVYGLVNTMEGSINAGLKGAGVSGQQKTLRGLTKETLISFGMPAGMIAGLIMGGPLGMVAGLLAGPGVTGGLLEMGEGALEGAKGGFTIAKEAAHKVYDKVEGKLGKVPATLAGAATFGVASIVVPIAVGVISFDKGLDFAAKAVGIIQPPANDKEVLSNFAHGLTVAVGTMAGFLNAPGILTMVPAGVAAGGGVATAVAGLKEGAKGVAQAYKDGMKIAGYTK
ncbi:MAG: hypothetical protein K8T10_14035 [Candidatus Eremiobacteraeota bacterium]|nr:hypothetical protein [Candidatus Eremiobacteraeota bacterium]